MSKRTYTDQNRAAVYAALQVNNGNVKRSARETGVPISTVRDWKREWEDGGLPEEVSEALPQVVEDIVEAFVRVRDKGLLELERQIERGDLKGSALVAAVGMMTDKIRLYQGQATQVREERMELPPPEQLRELVAGFFSGIVSAADERAGEIIEAEAWESADNREVAALPPAR